MGYDLHIIRAEDWTESGSDPITQNEWRGYVESDPEMEMTGRAEAIAGDGSHIVYENEGLAVWNGHSDGEEHWFDLRDGRVTVKDPDEEIVGKMYRIAEKLGARVQGDDGEFYDSEGNPVE